MMRSRLMTGLVWAACAVTAAAANLQIDGYPLQVRADEYGTVGVLRWQAGAPVPQYYAASAKGSALFLDGANAAARWGSGAATFVLWDDEATGRFSPVSHTAPDAQTLRTALAAGASGVAVTQTLRYTSGDLFYTLSWQIANAGLATCTNLHFIHGGDVSPGGEDFAQGFWMGASNMVYALSTNAPEGMMGLRGDAATPADGYQEAHFQLVRDAAKAGALSGTANAAPHDAAYALQWDRARLAPGETWTIQAIEVFAGTGGVAGAVEVFGPAAAPSGRAGDVLTNVFQVVNAQSLADTFSLSAASSLGWPFALPGGTNLSLAAWASTAVYVRVTIPAGAAPDTTNRLTLTATSQSDPGIAGSASALAIIQAEPPAGSVQVIGPAPAAGLPGDTLTNLFQVVNRQPTADNFSLSCVCSAGWPWWFSSGSNVAVAAWGTSSVPIRVAIPGAAPAGATNLMTLSVASLTTASVTGSAAAVTFVLAPPATGVWQDVSGRLLHPLFEDWRLSRQTGTYFGALRLTNTLSAPLTGPFYVAIQASPDMRFMKPGGTLKDGRPYIDLTAQVLAAQPDKALDPGDAVRIPDIEVYMKYRTLPPDSAFSVWATAPAPRDEE